MKENKAAENALGTIGAVFWTIQIIPQIVKSHRTKSTKGLSGSLMFIWAVSALFLGSYIVAQRLSIPLQIQPQLFGALASVSWAQCLHYDRSWSKNRAIAAAVIFCVIFGGFEAGSVFALWAGQDNGVNWPITLYGYITAILLAVALLPQYYEIYRLRQVVGISMTFMAVDILGGVFSFLSLFFRTELDRLAFASYLLVVILDGVVVVLALILNPIAKRHAREAGAAEEGRVEGQNDGQGDTTMGITSTDSTMVSPTAGGQELKQTHRSNQLEKPLERPSEDDDREEAPLSPSIPSHGHGYGQGHGLAHELGLDQDELAPMHFRTVSRTSASASASASASQ